MMVREITLRVFSRMREIPSSVKEALSAALEPPHTNDFCQYATKSLGLCQTTDFAAAE